ncbi:MAG: hypothetical protein ACLT4D_04555 [Blautia faecis]
MQDRHESRHDKAIINALMECAVSGTDIDARFAALQTELIALVA